MTKADRQLKYAQQETENFYCAEAWRWYNENLKVGELEEQSTKRLRSCQAWVITYKVRTTGEVFHILKSYNTVIGCSIGNSCFDWLRMVYGYTATSAQHFSKFWHDYGKTCNIYRWQYIGEYPA